MPSPETSSRLYQEVPEGAIFLPITREKALKIIESQVFQLFVGGRGPLGELPLEEKMDMHRKLTEERESILGAKALEAS